MSLISRFARTFFGEDDGSAGLYEKADGAIWVRQPDGSEAEVGAGGGGPWGGASSAKFSGSGSPVGVVTPSGEGDLYVDATTPALWQATGATDADWTRVSNGGSLPNPITDPVVVATDSGETPLSLQPDGAEVFVVSEFGEITVTQPVASSWPFRILNLDGQEIFTVKNSTGAKQVTLLGWGAGANALLVAIPVGNEHSHLISFDIHDDGALVGDLGHIRSENYGADNQTAITLQTTASEGGSSEWWGEGMLTLNKPASSTTDFIKAHSIFGGVDRFVVAKTGATVHQLSSGTSLTVKDSGGGEIFRVDEDGSIHIKTGTTIVADL